MATQTKTVTQWRREWRRLFKAEMKAARALPEYIEGMRLVREYEAARKRGDLDAMDRLDVAVEKSRKAWIAASRRLPQHAEMDRIQDMLRDFDTYGCAAGVRA